MTAHEPLLDAHALIHLGRVQHAAVSPCGMWAAVVVQRLDHEESAYINDLWRVSLTDSHEPLLLTRGDYQDSTPQFRADGALLFLSDRPTHAKKPDGDGGRRAQVFMLSPWGGEPSALTDEPLGVSAFKVARDGDMLVTMSPLLPDVSFDAQRATAERHKKHGPSALHYHTMPARYWDHWLPMATPHVVLHRGEERLDLTPAPGDAYRMASLAISPDGAHVAVTRSIPNATDRLHDQRVEVFETSAGARVATIAEPSLRVGYGALLFTPDSAGLVGVRDTRQEGAHGGSKLWHAPLADGAPTCIEHGLDAWLHPHAWAPDGTLLCTADWQGYTPVFGINIKTAHVIQLTDPAASGTHHCVDVATRGADSALITVRSTLLQPPELARAPLTEHATPTRITNLSGFDHSLSARFIAESVRVPSTDGEACQAHLVRLADAEEPLPALMWIHGGPIGQWGDVWHWRWCALVGAAQGHLMVLPNPRGSTGFGQRFVEGIWGNVWGGQCFEDLMAIADHVEARPDVDAARFSAMGGSFGGYMTAWIGTQTDRFRCLIDHAGVTSFPSFHGVTDLPSWWAHMLGVDPYEQPRALELYSPLHHIKGWRTPALVIHGQQDYRVPVGEALILFEALQHHGVTSELLIYPDENHWILKPNNIVSWYAHVFRFIATHSGEEAQG